MGRERCMESHDTPVARPGHLPGDYVASLPAGSFPVTLPLPGAADRQILHLQGRLTYPHGNALPVFAAGSDAVIQLEVIADHGDPGQHVRTVTDERRPFQGRADAAVLDR